MFGSTAARYLIPAAMLAANLLLGTQAGEAAPRSSLWHWEHPLPQGNALWDVNCASVRHCVAVGSHGTVLQTADGGASWQVPLTPTTERLDAVACPTIRRCYAVGGSFSSAGDNSVDVIIGSVDGGLTWKRQHRGNAHGLTSIACPNATICYAAGDDRVLATKDGGRTWLRQYESRVVNFVGVTISAVACPSTRVCYVAASLQSPHQPVPLIVLKTADGGRTWHSRTIAVHGDGAYVGGIACVSQTRCIITGNKVNPQNPEGAALHIILTTSDGGMHWQSVGQDRPGGLGRVVCDGTRTCYSGNLVTEDGGTTWTPSPSTSFPLTCPARRVCFGGSPSGGSTLISATRDGGRTWSSLGQSGSSAYGSFTSVSCPSLSICRASDGTVLWSTLNGGKQWTAGTSPIGPRQDVFESVACPTALTCVAVGYSVSVPMNLRIDSRGPAPIFLTVDGGKIWTSQPSPLGSTVANLAAVTCPSATLCFAAGTRYTGDEPAPPPDADPIDYQPLVLVTTDAGVNWAIAAGLSDAIARSTGVSTPNPSVGSSASDGTLSAISCADTYTCTAVGRWSAGQAPRPLIVTTVDGGRSWTATSPRREPTNAIQYLTGVSCPETTTCYAIGYDVSSGVGYVPFLLRTTDAGHTWVDGSAAMRTSLSARHPAIDGAETSAITCPDRDTCYAVGRHGTILVTKNGGARWRAQSSGTDNTLYAVTCTTVSQCRTVGNLESILASGPAT